MITRKSKLLIALSLVGLTSVSMAFGPKWGGPGPNGSGFRLAQVLELSEEQQSKVKEVMQAHREEGQKWREQHRSALENKLSSVLTEEQLEKFKAMKKNRPFQSRMKGKGHGGMGRHQCQKGML